MTNLVSEETAWVRARCAFQVKPRRCARRVQNAQRRGRVGVI